MEKYNNILKGLGMTKNESAIYNYLLQSKLIRAGKIIKETKLHRNIVYQELEKLINKGLVSYIYEGKIKQFRAESPEMLVSMIESKRDAIQNQLTIAQQLKKEIEDQLKKQPQKQEASIYRGVKGVQTAMNLFLSKKKDYLVLGSPKESVEIMPPKYWENFNLKLQKEKINVKMLFNLSLKKWAKNIKHKTNRIKFLPDRFDSITEINVGDDFIAVFVWTETPVVTVIQDINLANSYKKYFEHMWGIAEN